ncbi:MAG: RNA-binding S4 domain-containing protein [Candidatus Eremiobacteraeota bacterium]|nr:RNA-binding S4 domain-containing protein [Candidatus Eremiobacteraeota bacterium]
MRLDKYLKISRLAKRRREAKDALDAGKVFARGRPLKPGYDVKVGDLLEIHYFRKVLTVRVLAVPQRVVPGLRPVDLYEIVEERREDSLAWL